MNKAGAVMEKVVHWLHTGTETEVWIKKILMVSVGMYVSYRLGYAVGKLLFPMGA